MSIKLATESEALNLFRKYYGQGTRKNRIYSFYSSELNTIITDEHLMLIPIDDRMATRAHAVFDVVYIKKLQLINLESHIKRLFKSSESVCIEPPMSEEEASRVVQEVAKKTLQKEVKNGMRVEEVEREVYGLRLCISSGYGDFGIASLNKRPVFYLSIFEPYINYNIEREGVNEFVVKFVDNPKELVHSKTVDYTHNSLMANESKKRGGYQGIKALKNGVLLEAAVANIAFMFGKEFATPRFETVIEGTTIKKLLKYVEQLKEQGLIDKISQRDITIEEAQGASEMFVIGGDKIVPVLNFNSKPISEKKGPFATMFQDWYERENETSISIDIMSEL